MNPCRWLLRAVVLPSAVLLATTGPAHADALANPAPNQLYGHITSNRTLTVAAPGPNYEIIGDLTVDPGVTLTLERGVTITCTAFSDFLASGADPSMVEVTVNGAFVVPVGAQPVTVTSSVYKGWAGITIGSTGAAQLPSSRISNALVGLTLEAGASLFVCDSLSPAPAVITNCGTGIIPLGQITIANVVLYECEVGVNDVTPNGFKNITYCTFVNCTYGVLPNYAAAPVRVTNSIVYGGSGGGAGLRDVRVGRTDVWNYAQHGGHDFQRVIFEQPCSSFNPYFLGDGTFRLSPASFFTNYSVSGGEIGAWGPGPGSPVPVSGASLVSAEASDGVSRIRWYVGDPGLKASIIRRVDGGDWQPKTVLYADGTGYVDLEDRDVTPGTRYGYAVGTQQAGQIGIDGEVWLTVELPVLTGNQLAVVPNPTVDGWAVRFVAATPSRGTVEVVDLAGRCVSSQDLGLISPGTHSAYVPAGSLAPGVYWIRLRQGADLLQARAVKTK